MPPPHHQLPIVPNAESLASARDVIADMLRARGWSDDAIADAQLVTTELLSNAICHADPPLDLELELASDDLTIRVSDHSPDQLPGIMPEDQDRIGGWGLAIVDHIASRWGVSVVDHRKLVWAVVDAHAASAPS